jgi:hypothetical protein
MGKLNFGVAIEISRLNATASSLATQSLFTAAYAKGCLRLIWHFRLLYICNTSNELIAYFVITS